MKYYLIPYFLLITAITKAQSVKESYFEFKAGYMPTIGKVSVRGESTPWINTLPYDGNFNPDGDTFASTSLGIAYGKYLSPQLRLGVGADIDFYHNLSEGNTSRATPFYGDARYTFNNTGRGFYAYAQLGYSFITGTDWHSGFKTGLGLGYAIRGEDSKHGFNFSIGYNYQTLNRMIQQRRGAPIQGEGYFGPTTVQDIYFAGYKTIILQTLPIKIAYEF